MELWNKICGIILILLLFSVNISAQNHSTSLSLNYKTFFPKNNSFDFDSSSHNMSIASFSITPSAVSPNFSTCSYGFFCREELKFEKATHIPLRFRLGSLQQCNYYEGKNRNVTFF